jgi:PAS domain S-box-containing protein
MSIFQFDNTILRQVLQRFFETSFNAIVITGAEPDYPIQYVNPEFCRMTGYSVDELIGQSPRMLQGEKTNRKTLQRLKATIESGQFFHGAAMNYRKNGEAYPVEWNISPVYAADGKLTHYLSIQKDLSGLKRIVSSLKNTNEHFREFLMGLSTAVEHESTTVLRTMLANEKRELTDELLDNSKLYTGTLRSADNIDLFETDEFFDCSGDTFGLLSESAEAAEPISAVEYSAKYPASANMQQLLVLIREAQESIDLLPYSKDVAGDLNEIGQHIHDIATEVFYFEDFVGMASVLGELSIRTQHKSQTVPISVLLETYRGLLDDLGTWVNTVFIEKTASDIHELDNSIISSAKQLMFFLS